MGIEKKIRYNPLVTESYSLVGETGERLKVMSTVVKRMGFVVRQTWTQVQAQPPTGYVNLG